ncbi:hypothetical protein PIB30_058934 [Stylosanthes scabra]|uniref:Fe2OG dioxygenase domain-containing protein n=1 Tax=Stylosanthes scabra TaxID=79078 RepID=A0ABU6VJ52_9FABA|nr:hypothetical protein [Stylosanthes scabra]
MESAAPTVVHTPPLKVQKDQNGALIFDSNMMRKASEIPKEFLWPSDDLITTSDEALQEPLIDLAVLKSGDEEAIASAAQLLREACVKHGFFQVTNHGVDQEMIDAAHQEVDTIFGLPLERKLAARRQPGSVSGYSGAHSDRFSSKLPWKECFSFKYSHSDETHSQIIHYFSSLFGQDLHRTGSVYQKYCDSMKELSFAIMELLAISLGLDRLYIKTFFEDGESIMRCNSYPPCNRSSLTLGTGPHSDPTSLTILHQDQVGGLEVYLDNKWFAVRPRPDAFVINIGDTFMALSNGKYKSCLHRALVNREVERKSLVYFVNPKEDKTVKPPEKLCSSQQEERKYPDFTWSDLYEFTQNHYRADVSTLQGFIPWFIAGKPSKY